MQVGWKNDTQQFFDKLKSNQLFKMLGFVSLTPTLYLATYENGLKSKNGVFYFFDKRQFLNKRQGCNAPIAMPISPKIIMPFKGS